MQNFDISRVDAHALRIFVSVCDTGSISTTAGLFDINQSTVSHTIDKLRAAFGDPLFVKAGRGITPTERALQMRPRVHAILADLEGLASPGIFDPASETRPFSVAIASPALLDDMKLLHAKLGQLAQDSTLWVKRLAPRDTIVDMLEQAEVDLAIAVSGFRYPATLNHCKYGTDEFAVFYDPTVRHPVRTPQQYLEASHAAVSFGGAVKSEVEKAFSALGHKRKVSLVAPTTSMLSEFLRGSDLIATMPRTLATGSFRALAHCPPPVVLPPLSYDLVWHRRAENSGRGGWLRRLMLEVRSELARTTEGRDLR